MSDKKYLTPETNELIPTNGPSRDNDGTLLDPRVNELIPTDGQGPAEPPNELCPGYIEPPKKVAVQTGDLMSVLTAAAEEAQGGVHGCSTRERVEIAPGLWGSFCPSGGLTVFKNGVQVVDRMELSVEDRAAMNDFLDRERK
jgi:hypothetical protein